MFGQLDTSATSPDIAKHTGLYSTSTQSSNKMPGADAFLATTGGDWGRPISIGGGCVA